MNINARRNFLKTLGLGTGAAIIPATAKAGETSTAIDPAAPKPKAAKNQKLFVNSYYYAPHNHSLLQRHLDYDLARMKTIGTDAVSFCVQESQLDNWNFKRIHNVVDRIHDFGMEAHAVPNRWGGLLAGWLDGYSNWSVINRDTWLPASAKEIQAASDPKSPKLIEWYQKNAKRLVTEFKFDGVIWDEPRPFENLDVFFFLNDMSAYIKSVKPDAKISIFAESTCLHLGETFPKLNHIDYLGSDGHVRSVDHKMARMKTTIFEAHKVFHDSLTAAGRKTFFLLEGHRHRDEDLENYLANIEKAVNLPMDHLMYYYSAHEMSLKNEATFNEGTWRAIAGVKGIPYQPLV